MLPAKIENHTAKFGAPSALTEPKVGILYIREELVDGLRFMRSAWQPTPAELAAINAGAPIILGISTPNAHPVVHMTVGNIPSDDEPAPAADELTFAKVGGPPEDWKDLRIIDLSTGQDFVGSAIEIDTRAGYVITCKVDENGNPIEVDGVKQTVKIHGRYKLERRK